MYLFVIVTALAIALGTAAISYFINADQIDRYYKQLAVDSANNFADMVDGEFLKELRVVAESEEYQELRDAAEEADDESMIQAYLEDKGLWDRYASEQAQLAQYLDNMTNIRYLYITAIGGPDAVVDMYLLDSYEEPIYETGYYEDREEELYGIGNTGPIPPSISNGDWGYLCSAWQPVYDTDGSVICHVGCDISMDQVREERIRFLSVMLVIALIFTALVLLAAMLFANRVVVKPIKDITNGMQKFSPSESLSYEDAGVLELKMKNRDEIGDLYESIRSMQKNLIDYLKDISVMENEKEKRDAELNVAAKMQSDMLPAEPPKQDQLSLCASMTPAREMGGDFYDYFLIDDDHLALVMADVSGKGVPAAIFMIVVKALLKRRVMQGGKPSKMLEDVNNAIYEENPSQLFVTVWLGILTVSTGELVYSNAGHEYPAFMQKDEDYEAMKAENMPPLGIVPDLTYYDITIRMKKGDRLFLYTDGVPEAKNENGERFGLDYMLRILNEGKEDPPEALLDRITKSVDAFTGGADLFDDITMLSLVMK